MTVAMQSVRMGLQTAAAAATLKNVAAKKQESAQANKPAKAPAKLVLADSNKTEEERQETDAPSSDKQVSLPYDPELLCVHVRDDFVSCMRLLLPAHLGKMMRRGISAPH